MFDGNPRAPPSFRWPVALPVSTLASSALLLLVSSWVLYDLQIDRIVNHELHNPGPSYRFSAFDYIVVGAGTAGMVVATRIANASAADSRILLLEAGGEPSPLNDISALGVLLGRQPANTWKYPSPRNPKCCVNYDGQRASSTRGKVLGGSSSVNFMMYVRGNKEDFNRWANEDARGDEAWNYQNLLPYFKKSEDYNGAYSTDGFKKIVDLYENTVALNASLFPKPVPGCEADDELFKSDDYYRCRHYTGSLFHLCPGGRIW